MDDQTMILLTKIILFFTLIWYLIFVYIMEKSEQQKRVSKTTKISLYVLTPMAIIITTMFVFYLLSAMIAGSQHTKTIYGGLTIKTESIIAWTSIIISTIAIILVNWITLKINKDVTTK